VPSMRCSFCDINFPYDRTSCQSCGAELWWVKDQSHDTDWYTQVISKARRVWLPDLDIEVITKDGYSFVAHELLKDAEIEDLATDDILKIRGQFYQVVGALKGDTPAWMIELIPVEYDLDHPVLSQQEYEALEERRGRR